jgi:cytosolic iron-sulfur protein assembly protein CIAO1
MIASASFDGTVVVWESHSGSKCHWDMIASLEGHENEVKSVCWSCDGRWIATCGRDKTVWIWEDVGRGEFECVTVLNGHTQDVKFVKFHPHLSSVLFSCSYDDTIRVWKEEGDDWYCAETLTGHSSTVWALGMNIAGTQMVSGSADLSIVCWQDTSAGSGKGVHGNSWVKTHTLSDVHRYPIYRFVHTAFIFKLN